MGDRLAAIVRGILKEKFIRAIGERKWTAQDEESINKLSDFFTEFDQRLTALEGGAGSCPKCAEAHKMFEHPAPTPATVEKYTVYGFIKLQYCVGDGGGSLQYQNHFVRSAIGEVVATLALPHEYTKTQVVLTLPDGQSINLFTEEYRALVTMMVDNKYWEKING